MGLRPIPKWHRGSPAPLVLLALLLSMASCGSAFGPDAGEGAEWNGVEASVARLVNDHRASIGCRRLKWNEEVAKVAVAHSADMRERAFFGHQDPEGKGLAQRLRSAGVPYFVAAENIAIGYRYEDAARAVFEGWMKSASHREIIESCVFTRHGIGFVDYHWTHVFAR